MRRGPPRERARGCLKLPQLPRGEPPLQPPPRRPRFSSRNGKRLRRRLFHLPGIRLHHGDAGRRFRLLAVNAVELEPVLQPLQLVRAQLLRLQRRRIGRPHGAVCDLRCPHVIEGMVRLISLEPGHDRSPYLSRTTPTNRQRTVAAEDVETASLRRENSLRKRGLSVPSDLVPDRPGCHSTPLRAAYRLRTEGSK